MYVTMDSGNPDVTILKEPITDLHFPSHYDVIEQPTKNQYSPFDHILVAIFHLRPCQINYLFIIRFSLQFRVGGFLLLNVC